MDLEPSLLFSISIQLWKNKVKKNTSVLNSIIIQPSRAEYTTIFGIYGLYVIDCSFSFIISKSIREIENVKLKSINLNGSRSERILKSKLMKKVLSILDTR